jgi:hypothetical protein
MTWRCIPLKGSDSVKKKFTQSKDCPNVFAHSFIFLARRIQQTTIYLLFTQTTSSFCKNLILTLIFEKFYWYGSISSNPSSSNDSLLNDSSSNPSLSNFFVKQQFNNRQFVELFFCQTIFCQTIFFVELSKKILAILAILVPTFFYKAYFWG